MNAERWKKVEGIFHTAAALSVEERNYFLQTECADDGELFSEVESLINSFEFGSHILDEPVFEIGLGAINETSQKNLTGSTIGFYKLEEKIGAGGMGEVYKAVDTRLNRRVALKFLSAALENERAAKRQFVKEARAVAMLEHPNICAIHGIEETDAHNFIVMQYIEGITLADRTENETVGVEEFKSLARQIVTAVAFAHSHGVIHRDLKPGNIMLSGGGEIKVLDFGLAQIIPQKQIFGGDAADNDVSHFSNSGLIIGTVAYMSPEQLRGERLDYRSDIFSLGITLYEIIAAQNPFKRMSQAETIAAILSEEPIALHKLAPDFPAVLVNIIEKCLHKQPADRFQSAAEIAVELDKAESANVIRTLSKRRKHFLLKWTSAVIFLFAVCSVLLFYNGKSPQRVIAVLPISFDNAPTEKEYLADGVTQSIIDKLSNLSDLKVKNQYMVSNFKGKVIEPQKVGKELNVDAVFVGSIFKRDNTLLLAAKIYRTSDGEVVDDKEFEINETDLIELQENVTAQIISKIKSNLTDDDKSKLAKKDTENAAAKLLYIRGRHFLERQEDGDLKNAERSFKEATELDPAYAKAWTGLADTFTLFSVPGHKGAISPEEAAKLAKAAAKKAIEIDETLCEPYVSLGMINLKYEWDWGVAEGYFKSAISRNSEFPQAHLGLSNLLIIKGDYNGSIVEAQKAKDLSPFSVMPDLSLARSYYFERNYEQMDKVLTKSLENFPNHKRLNYFRGLQYLATYSLPEAAQIFEKLYQEDKIYGAAPLGLCYGRMGRKAEAQKILAVLDEKSKKVDEDYVAPQERAMVYLGLGEIKKVFEYLSDSCAEKYPAFPFVVTDPIFDEIRSDPRFTDIKKCANL